MTELRQYSATYARPIRDLLREDIKHMVANDGKGQPLWVAEAMTKTLLYPRMRAVVCYRLGQLLYRKRMLPLAYLLVSRAVRASGAEISPIAEIGPGLCLMHSVGIVIGPEVRVGRNLRIYHGVTLGDGARSGQPQIGDDVLIGAGAAVLGGVRIGHRVIVGAHSVVTRDIPDDHVATGAPATFRPRSDRHAFYGREPSTADDDVQSTAG